MKRIVCYGDSNTWGYDAKRGARFSESVRWTGLLQEMLGAKVRIVEEGLNGRTASFPDPLGEGLNAMDHIHACIRSQSPMDLLVIMLGTNDTKSRFGATAYNIAQGILQLVRKDRVSLGESYSVDPKILVVCPPVIGAAYVHTPAVFSIGEGCHEKSRALSGHLRTLLREEGVDFFDAGVEVDFGDTDHMHLDAEGHQAMARVLFREIRQRLDL